MGLTRRDLDEIATIFEQKAKTIFDDENYIKKIAEKICKTIDDKYKHNLESLKMENSLLKMEIDDLNQERRLKNLRIFGVQENQARI